MNTVDEINEKISAIKHDIENLNSEIQELKNIDIEKLIKEKSEIDNLIQTINQLRLVKIDNPNTNKKSKNVSNIERIIKEYCYLTSTDYQILMSKSRKRHFVCIRAIISVFLFEKGMNKTQIGLIFNKEHSTVWNWIELHESYLKTDNNYKELNEIFEKHKSEFDLIYNS